MTLKGEVDRTPRLTKAQASWISQEIWRLADRQATLQRSVRAIVTEVRQVRRKFL